MKCPHCTVEIYWNSQSGPVGGGHPTYCFDSTGRWQTDAGICPSCEKLIIYLCCEVDTDTTDGFGTEKIRYLVHPRGVARSPLPDCVPEKFAQDYREACLVLADSPKASAALTRRCLQHVLREAANTKKTNLSEQIDEVLPKLPSYLADLIDAVRTVGNFAAHPMKSTNTGEIVDVEPGEADLLLEVIEMAFDFYFVQPEQAKKRRDALNAKLKEVGKPPMK